MHLTSFTDYGLRVLIRLAGQPGATLTTRDIAEEFAISRHHLTKVVQELAAAGLVRTSRGVGGGIALARPAAQIRLGAVVRHLEAPQALVECFRPDGGACRLLPHCLLKSRLAAARDAFIAELDRHTLADCAYGGPLPGNPPPA